MICVILSIVVYFVSMAPVLAEPDYSKTINLAGKQRMLSQKMAKESLLIALDIDKDENLKNLYSTHRLFSQTLRGLQLGDEDLGLKAVKNPMIQRQLSAVMALWRDYSAELMWVMDNQAVMGQKISIIANLSLELLREMNRAVKLYELEASDGMLDTARAITLNIAGRQRMLTQKMSKEFLLVALGRNVEKNRRNLDRTVRLFNVSMQDLIEGNTLLGLSPPPTQAIMEQLMIVQKQWHEFRVVVQSTPTPDSIALVASQNLPLLREMHKVVEMYEAL